MVAPKRVDAHSNETQARIQLYDRREISLTGALPMWKSFICRPLCVVPENSKIGNEIIIISVINIVSNRYLVKTKWTSSWMLAPLLFSNQKSTLAV